eukprot:365031-Chlamydomonas_euryale.AAC.6
MPARTGSSMGYGGVERRGTGGDVGEFRGPTQVGWGGAHGGSGSCSTSPERHGGTDGLMATTCVHTLRPHTNSLSRHASTADELADAAQSLEHTQQSTQTCRDCTGIKVLGRLPETS